MRKKTYTDAELTQIVESISECKFVETYRKQNKHGSLRMLRLVCGCGERFDVAWNKFNRSDGVPQRQCQECGKELRAAQHRKTDEDYQREKARLGINIKNIDPYVTGHTPIRHICPSCSSFDWRPTPNSILQRNSTQCPKCSIGLIAGHNKLSDEDYQRIKQEKGINVINVHGYLGWYVPIWHICPECSGGWLVRPGNVIAGNKTCTPCSYKIRAKNQVLSDEDVTSLLTGMSVEWVSGEYTSQDSTLTLRCECGNTFKKPFSDVRNGWNRCSKCAQSISTGEKAIKDYLDANATQYIHQQKFDDLRGKRNMPLSYDFGIYSEGNLTALVEYDGEHHFRPIVRNGTYEDAVQTYEGVKSRDARKDAYAQSLGVPLLRLSGLDYKNLDAKLGEQLKTIKQYANTEVSENITRHRNA